MQSLRFCPSRFVRPKFSRGARPLIDVWYVIVIVALIAAGRTDAGSSDPYQIVNLMPRFWKAVETSLNQTPDQQVKSFRDIMGVSATDLYSETDLGFGSSEQLDEAILKTLSNAREYSTEIHHASDALVQTLPACIEKFKQTFPDFSATFPIFILVSLGQLDGAGRVVDGRPCLLLGVDNIASEFSPAILPIFLDHELFHRYHYQVAGFSDDNGGRELIWRALWAEGLATYVSTSLNPPATLQDGLFVPHDLVKKADPILPSLAAEISPKLDEVDHQFFAKFFLYHPSTGALPSRSGYYVGARVAATLARQKSLFELAHLQSETVRSKIGDILAEMAKTQVTP
ncbi:MAG: hypothetical protein JOZ08_24330 [Verrucomicrobia bacterium]|nr:hypothetical protein [Verrucomicrobiota bacterium]